MADAISGLSTLRAKHSRLSKTTSIPSEDASTVALLGLRPISGWLRRLGVIHGSREQARTKRGRFWLTDAHFARIASHPPTDTRGRPGVDDRRVISGIAHVLKSGGRWIDAPPDYGPRKTLYNRYVRWAAKGVWIDLFHALASAGAPAPVFIDSSTVKAHRSAAGGKRGDATKPSAARAAGLPPRSTR